MLELPSHSSKHRHTLQLRDGTAAVACVLTESSEEAEGGQRAAFNTAWIGTEPRCHRERSKVTDYNLSDLFVCRLSGVCPPLYHGNREISTVTFPFIPTSGPRAVHHRQTLQVLYIFKFYFKYIDIY